MVAEFTVSSLKSWQWAKGSVFYLLGLWSRLVSSMPYLKGDAPSLLETYVPKIMDAYMTSRYPTNVILLHHAFPHYRPPINAVHDTQDVAGSIQRLHHTLSINVPIRVSMCLSMVLCQFSDLGATLILICGTYLWNK